MAIIAVFLYRISLKNSLWVGSNVMKESAHAHSALIQNRQFRARIARKKYDYFNKVGRKI